jgi:hypothetical protein
MEWKQVLYNKPSSLLPVTYLAWQILLHGKLYFGSNLLNMDSPGPCIVCDYSKEFCIRNISDKFFS